VPAVQELSKGKRRSEKGGWRMNSCGLLKDDKKHYIEHMLWKNLIYLLLDFAIKTQIIHEFNV